MENDATGLDKLRGARKIQKAELGRAKRAAIAGDPTTFLEAMFNSHLPYALIWRLQSQLPEDDVDDIIADGLVSTYEAIRVPGREIELASYFSKVCYNLANARYAMRKNVSAIDSADLERLGGTRDAEIELSLAQQAQIEQQADLRRLEAVRLARTLLPRIGEENIQRVMSIVLDAVENGLVDLSHREIAEMVGLSEGTVQKLVSRGFERLEREARHDGLWLDVNDVITIEQENPF